MAEKIVRGDETVLIRAVELYRIDAPKLKPILFVAALLMEISEFSF